MAFCMECGHRLEVAGKFCSNCGTAKGSTKQGLTPKIERPKTRHSASLIIGLITIILIIGGVGTTFLQTYKSKGALTNAERELVNSSGQMTEEKEGTRVISKVSNNESNNESEPKADKFEKIDSELVEFEEAKASIRITNLGEFTKKYPESIKREEVRSLALQSLVRQNNYDAYITYKKFFGDISISEYEGPRVEGIDMIVKTAIDSGSVKQISSALRKIVKIDPHLLRYEGLHSNAIEAAANIVKKSGTENAFEDYNKYLVSQIEPKEFGYHYYTYFDDYTGPIYIKRWGFTCVLNFLDGDVDSKKGITITGRNHKITKMTLQREEYDSRYTYFFEDGRVMNIVGDGPLDGTCDWETGGGCNSVINDENSSEFYDLEKFLKYVETLYGFLLD